MYSVIVSRREENIVPTALVTSELLHHGDRHLPRLKVPDLLCLANQRPEATVIRGWDCTMTDWWMMLTLLVFHTPRIIKATWVHFLFVCSVLRIQGLTVSIASLVWLAFEWSSPGECDTVAWREAGGGEWVSLPSPHFPLSHPGQALAILSGEYDALITDFIPSLSIAAQFSSAEDYWRH